MHSLKSVFEDLYVRFVLNLPPEETSSFQRLGFQIEQAFWFYEENRQENFPALPVLRMRSFFEMLCEMFPQTVKRFLSKRTPTFKELYELFIRYKLSVPCSGAIILDPTLSSVLMVKGTAKKSRWAFPRGKINKDEPYLFCALREVYEETGIDISPFVDPETYIDVQTREKQVRLFVVHGVEASNPAPQTANEISAISWHSLDTVLSSSDSAYYADMADSFEKLRPVVASLRSRLSRAEAQHRFCFRVPLIMAAYRGVQI